MSLRSVILMDENRTPAQVNDLVGHLVIIDSVHAHIHDGDMFQADFVDMALANDGTLELLVQVGMNEGAHMRFRVAAGGNARAELFEAPTFSVAGTAVPALNRNRRSATVASVTVTHTPTTSVDGTQLADALIPGGTGGNAGGGQADSFQEWILDANQDYLFRTTNIAGQTQPVFAGLDWYEPGPPVTP